MDAHEDSCDDRTTNILATLACPLPTYAGLSLFLPSGSVDLMTSPLYVSFHAPANSPRAVQLPFTKMAARLLPGCPAGAARQALHKGERCHCGRNITNALNSQNASGSRHRLPRLDTTTGWGLPSHACPATGYLLSEYPALHQKWLKEGRVLVHCSTSGGFGDYLRSIPSVVVLSMLLELALVLTYAASSQLESRRGQIPWATTAGRIPDHRRPYHTGAMCQRTTRSTCGVSRRYTSTCRACSTGLTLSGAVAFTSSAAAPMATPRQLGAQTVDVYSLRRMSSESVARSL